MGVCSFFFYRLLPFIVLVLSVFIGWMAQHELPLGVFFATIIPISKGYLPPTLFGAYSTPLTAAIPDDLKPSPRPEGEMFLTLPGSSDESPLRMPQAGLGMCCRPGAYDHETVRRSVLWHVFDSPLSFSLFALN
jgi:hypothetical protein